MIYNKKEEYERLIRASILFSLNRETEYTAYRKEARKMTEYLYCYLLSINEEKYIEFGAEILTTATNCIKNYAPENGDFLNYFNSAMKKEYRRAFAKKQIDEMRHGIHVSEEVEANIRKIVRYMKSKGITQVSDRRIHDIAENLGIPEGKVREYITVNLNATAISDETVNDDGEESSLFDTLADDGEDIHKTHEESENYKELLLKIEDVYRSCQDRQKPIISEIMTAKVCETICEMKISTEGISFIDKEIIVRYIKTGITPTQRDIAKKYQKEEASISRTVSKFEEKLKQNLKI